MKKLLKSKIYGSVNSAYRALFTEKVKYFGSKKKKKNQKKRKTCVWEAQTHFPNALLVHITTPIGATFLRQQYAQRKPVEPSVGT